MTRPRWHRHQTGWLALAAAGLLAHGAQDPGPTVQVGVSGDGLTEARPLPLPPVYPAPPPGTLVLPATPPPVRPHEPGRLEPPTWIPGGVELRVGIAPGGGIVHFRQDVPGRFHP